MRTHNNKAITICWAYLGEGLLSAIFTTAAYIWVPIGVLNNLLFNNIGTWTTVLGILLGLSVGLLTIFATLLTRPFGLWLHNRKSVFVFAVGFTFPLFVYCFAIILLVVSKEISSSLKTLLAIFALLYSCLNMLTQVQNLLEFLRLYLEHERIMQIDDSNNGIDSD